MGLVQVDQRGVAPGSFDRGDLEVLVVLAHQAAMALENARLNAGLKESCEQAVRGLVRALEAKDEYTSGHSEAVAELCARVAMAMGLPPEAVDTTRRAALLHDIGKIGIPHAVLNKTGPLTPEEFRVLKTHPTLGARILEPLQFLADLVPVVLHHHERWDGRGYPAALAGLAIPPGARILAAVDTYHALVSDRAYRAGVGRDVALAELKRCSGTQFDPDVIAALERVLAAEAAPVGEPAEVGADA
jgi:putative nucleotidyltransferase with HDIG domain